ncbi:hypothetical protein ACO0QE_000352 [Hanseniaspora vineae]
MSEEIEKRIFVGNIHNNLQECCQELYKRFQKWGTVTSKNFEEHDHFAYVNVTFQNLDQFYKLKRQFNNVKFMGNTLKIDEAKEDFYARWIRENVNNEETALKEKVKKNQMLKHEWEHYKKEQNIKMSWKDRRQVIYGRHRTHARSAKQLRKVTFRIFNERGELKVYKCYKNKLWGYDKKKSIRDLVFEFSNNKYWKDGNQHIIERLDFSKSKVFFANGDYLRISSKFQKADTSGNSTTFSSSSNGKDLEESFDEDDESKLQKEHNVNNAVLDSLLGSFNFEKPMDLNNGIEENEEDGSSDYEFSNKYLDQSSDEEDNETSEETNIKKTSKDTTNPKKEKVETQRSEEKSAPEKEDDDEEEEEFVPSFGAPATGTVSNTETLRGLFANPETSTFKLIQEDDEDINHEKDEEIEATLESEIPNPPVNYEDNSVPSKAKDKSVGLFFPHFDSYFLNGQTQLSKLKPKRIETYDSWDKEFWDHRAEWTKELRQKKRDAIRKWKKKNNKSTMLL